MNATAAKETSPRRLALLLGCLVVLAAAALAAFIAVILFFAFSLIRESEPAAGVLRWSAQHPDLRQQLGEPIEAGWLISGRVSTSGPGGEASLEIPLSGPRGNGSVLLEAERSAGVWRFEHLIFRNDAGGADLDLLPCPADARPCPLEGTSDRVER